MPPNGHQSSKETRTFSTIVNQIVNNVNLTYIVDSPHIDNLIRGEYIRLTCKKQ